jgi:hypothetical protein
VAFVSAAKPFSGLGKNWSNLLMIFLARAA